MSGYEKTLKWSTKYEVLQPVQFGSPPEPGFTSDVTQNPPLVANITLSPEVVSGFEALAAVLPTRKRNPEPESESALKEPERQSLPPDIGLDPTSIVQENPVENNQTPPTLEQSPIDSLNGFDPISSDDTLEGPDILFDDIALDSLLDFSDPGSLLDIDLDIEEVERHLDEPYSSQLTNSRLPRSLLLDYYRFPSPSPSCPSLEDVESMLIQHYFKEVCVLFSSFDSLLNPFRTTIGRIFQDSSSIYYAIQSMAAAHLANSFPNMAAIGVKMQHKSCESLQEELSLVSVGQGNCTRTFLSIILLGMTTSWHKSSALGEEFLTTARSLILPKLLCNSEDEQVQRETQFFEESLIYWEMLIGFVTQDSFDFSSGPRLRNKAMPRRNTPAARNSDGKIVPHPWTGIAPTIQILFAEVGRLIRRERMLDINETVDLCQRQDNLLNAATLEEDLLEAELPMIDELADPGDERTSRDHFVLIAEAYRCAGLLEIYRVFPCILRKRLGTNRLAPASVIAFEFPTPRFDTTYEDTDTALWRNSLALHVLSILETLPTSSGTICVQPILLLAAASELKLVSSLDFFDIHANDARVLQAREFAHRKLQECSLRLPEKPVKKVLELVKEVWRRLDAGNDVFWYEFFAQALGYRLAQLLDFFSSAFADYWVVSEILYSSCWTLWL